MIETEVATFEQITALLSHLMTNYSTMAITYYDMFYNTVPKDIVIKLYDNDGNLKQYTIPNRAKDFRFTLNGTGSPEGAISANIGTTYQDTLNGKLYIKESASGDVTGWVLVGSDEFIKNGEGSPENVLLAPKGTLYIDKANSGLYIKGTDTGRTGWSLISANTSNLADRNLENLSSTGESHFQAPLVSGINIKTINNNSILGIGNISLDFVNKQQITNCILEDPQNINLTLNNGTLTLKAGSVVCVPNGFESDGVTPKFNEITIASDISITVSGARTCVLVCNTSGNSLSIANIEHCSSGTTWGGGGTYSLFYNTSINFCSKTSDGGSSWENTSFPIAILTVNATQITEIRQAFQSIGYIGSTVFARKGLKVLIPNGRNADGSLKNIEHTLSKTITCTNSDTSVNLGIVLLANETLFTWAKGYGNGKFYYYENGNAYYASDTFTQMICIGDCDRTNGVISNFKPYTATNILKYSDKSQISGWGMPSTSYIGLTLGASGATYTAPANGYYVLSKEVSAAGQYVNIINSSNGIISQLIAVGAGDNLVVSCPVKKGAQVFVGYSAGGTTNYFRFIYSEGEV